MAVAIQHTTNQSLMSTIDALWTLIQSQPKAIRKALAQRMAKSDVEEETRRQEMELRKGLFKAFSELSEAKRTGRELPDAWDLLKELKEE